MRVDIKIANKERIKEDFVPTQKHIDNYKKKCEEMGIKPTELKQKQFRSFDDSNYKRD